MRLLLCLFSLYILVLAGIPCRADDDCCIDEIAANAAHPQPAKQRPTYPSPCSPFFACGACHGFVVPEVYIPIPTHRPCPSKRQTIYKGQPLPDFAPSIWQPPKTA